MCFTRKNFKVVLHPSKSFFCHLVQTLAFFHMKHVHIYVLVEYESIKKFQIEKNVINKKFIGTLGIIPK